MIFQVILGNIITLLILGLILFIIYIVNKDYINNLINSLKDKYNSLISLIDSLKNLIDKFPFK